MTALGLNLFRRRTRVQVKEPEQPARRPNIPKEVSENIREAYSQALFLVERCPKASGALSRFCLQQIVRDFWNIPPDKRGTLISEFSQVTDRMSEETRSSIDCVRQYGSIDSQFSKDRDMMVDTTVDEAKMLIALIQLLIQEWYVERDNRKKRFRTLEQRAQASKLSQRDEPTLESSINSDDSKFSVKPQDIALAQDSGLDVEKKPGTLEKSKKEKKAVQKAD